jgi:hypothetical protein
MFHRFVHVDPCELRRGKRQLEAFHQQRLTWSLVELLNGRP